MIKVQTSIPDIDFLVLGVRLYGLEFQGDEQTQWKKPMSEFRNETF